MYSATLMEHFTNPRNVGPMDEPDVVGQAGAPGQGPFMVLHLATDDDHIVDAKFQTYGCGPAIAAGSLLTELIMSRSCAECARLSAGDIVDGLGGMPEEKMHCAQLAVDALRNALAGWRPSQAGGAAASDP